MNTEMTLDLLTRGFKHSAAADIIAKVDFIEGDTNVIQLIIKDREEFPVYISLDDSQILCLSYLWKEQEVRQDKRADLLDALLTMNIPMPLSSFSKLGEQYIIFGALTVQTDIDTVLHEIKVLSDNTLDAIEALAEYLY